METLTVPETKRPKTKATTKRFALTLKNKGGSGASFIARFLGELHEQRKTGAYLVDGDGTTASLSKHFGLPRENAASPAQSNPENPVHTFSLHGAEVERDELAGLVEVEAQRVLLDLPATSLTVLRKIQAEYRWTDLLVRHGWRPTVIASITPFEESLFDLADAIEMFGDRADYVAFVNLGLAEERADFKLWDESKTRQKFLDSGGTEIEFPRLKPRIAAALQKYYLTFTAGVTSPQLGIADRSRLAKWFTDAEAAIEPAADRLGF